MAAWIRRRLDSARGFTLVERLVVTAIIALFISILLPALNAARNTAGATACPGNLRQVGIAAPIGFFSASGRGGCSYPSTSYWTTFPPSTADEMLMA